MKVSDLMELLASMDAQSAVLVLDNTKGQLFGISGVSKEFSNMYSETWGIITSQSEEEVRQVYEDRGEAIPESLKYVTVLRYVE